MAAIHTRSLGRRETTGNTALSLNDLSVTRDDGMAVVGGGELKIKPVSACWWPANPAPAEPW
jgi:hypothetical protein